MEYQTIGSNTHGQHVIGKPLVQQIVGRGPVLVCNENVVSAVLLVIQHPLLHILTGNVNGFFSYCFAPEIIGLGKYGEAEVAVFGRIGCGVTGCSVEYPSEGPGIEIGNKSLQRYL